MNKPIIAALGAFSGSSIAILVVSYVKQEQPAYGYAIVFGSAMAAAMYVFAQWKYQKPEENEASSPDEAD